MGGGGSQNSTVRNVTEVDPVTQQWRQTLMNAGGELYNQGSPAYYPGQTVTPFSNQTQAGLDYLQSYAMQGAPNFGMANDANARAMSGFNPAMPYANSWASGQNPLLQGVLGAANANNPYGGNIAAAGAANNPMMGQQTTAGMDALQGFSSASNPHLRGLFDQGAAQVSDAVNANFARSGRYASGAHTGTLGRELGNLYNNIYAPAYEASQGRALQAAGQMAGIQQNDLARNAQIGEAGLDRNFGAAQTLGSMFEQGAQRGLSGASQAAGYGMQGADLFGGLYSQGNQDAARAIALQPGLYSYGQMPGQSMLDIGGMYESQAQRYLDADRGRYEYTANAPWNNLQRYAQLMSGMPDFSGSTQTSTQPGPNRMMSGLGGAATGLGMLSGLQGMGLLTGAGAGTAGLFGGAGALLGLFSDRRLKREIVPLGADDNGQPWYEYSYIWDEPGVRRVGVMADEAPPHAVSVHPSGYLMVDYGAL